MFRGNYNVSCFLIYKKFKFYHMDVKSEFLNGNLEEQVYIEKLEGVSSTKNQNFVYRLKKALYGLKQALKA